MHAQTMSASNTNAAREWAWTVIYVLVVRASTSASVDPSVSMGCEHGCECMCQCECDFESNRNCRRKCTGENRRSKERRVCVQGFSTATSPVDMCACLSCRGRCKLVRPVARPTPTHNTLLSQLSPQPRVPPPDSLSLGHNRTLTPNPEWPSSPHRRTLAPLHPVSPCL